MDQSQGKEKAHVPMVKESGMRKDAFVLLMMIQELE
jgi:hypothetical protein